MSEYRKLKTTFKSRAYLRAALEASGVLFEEVLPGQPARHLYGYEGDERPETATFIVRRDQIGSLSNDLGYRWSPQARGFEEVVSEYDQGLARCTEIRRDVKREYAVAATVSRARAKGYRVRRVNQPGGGVQLQITGRV